MEFFSGSKPNLISNNTLDQINNLIGSSKIEEPKDIKINDGVSNFYLNYIQPNLFFIFLAILFLLFLYWKYETKKSENYKTTKKSKKNKKIHKKLDNVFIDELINTIESNSQNNDDNNNFVANFNPSMPISVQQNYTNYMDNQVPIAVNGNKTTYQQFYNNLEPEYNYMPNIENRINRADTYANLYNNYNNYQDQNYQNPFGWEQNFNQSTFDAIEYATQKNRESVGLLNQMVDQNNYELTKNIM